MNHGHILVTTDFSPEATRPFEAIKELALKTGSRVTLLNVVPEVAAVAAAMAYAPVMVGETLALQRDDAERNIRIQRATFEPEVAVETAVLAGGDIGETVAEYARSHGVDLIALSSHGRSGIRRIVMGSVAEDILRHASVPVLVFPPSGE